MGLGNRLGEEERRNWVTDWKNKHIVYKKVTQSEVHVHRVAPSQEPEQASLLPKRQQVRHCNRQGEDERMVYRLQQQRSTQSLPRSVRQLREKPHQCTAAGIGGGSANVVMCALLVNKFYSSKIFCVVSPRNIYALYHKTYFESLCPAMFTKFITNLLMCSW